MGSFLRVYGHLQEEFIQFSSTAGIDEPLPILAIDSALPVFIPILWPSQILVRKLSASEYSWFVCRLFLFQRKQIVLSRPNDMQAMAA